MRHDQAFARRAIGAGAQRDRRASVGVEVHRDAPAADHFITSGDAFAGRVVRHVPGQIPSAPAIELARQQFHSRFCPVHGRVALDVNDVCHGGRSVSPVDVLSLRHEGGKGVDHARGRRTPCRGAPDGGRSGGEGGLRPGGHRRGCDGEGDERVAAGAAMNRARRWCRHRRRLAALTEAFHREVFLFRPGGRADAAGSRRAWCLREPCRSGLDALFCQNVGLGGSIVNSVR